MSANIESLLGSVKVFTTQGRGSSAEELADRAVDKIIHVGQNSDPVIIAQAQAFKERIRAVLVVYLKEAQRAERDTVCFRLSRHGQNDAVQLIRDME